MRFLFTRSTILSPDWDIITWGLCEPVSHVGIKIGEKVYHWNITGFHIDSLETFTKTRVIIYYKDYPFTSKATKSVGTYMKTRWTGTSFYDYFYFFWLTYRAILKLVFKIKIPFKEPFGDTSFNYICHEIPEALPENVRPKYDRDKANTPYRLAKALGAEKYINMEGK